jgi:acetolactate synthase-1/2/3 large subunit
MNGAESLIRSLVRSGVDVCFANPGTSEMHFVAALDAVEEMRAVLCLFEGVATGAADGYGRMTERPAATLLHLGPGLANGLANLHNARRAGTPIVNIVGDHATYHAQYDPPLASDVEGFARPVSAWVHSSASASTVGADVARAVQAAHEAPGQIATLILPADVAWLEAERSYPALPLRAAQAVADDAIDSAAAQLGSGRRCAILMRGAALKEEGLHAAGRIAAATGCRLLCDTLSPRLRRGAGVVAVERIPYFAEQIAEFLAEVETLILVGARPPVSFFAYPDKPSWCVPEGCEIVHLAHPHEDGIAALLTLAEAVHAPAQPAHVAALERPELVAGRFNAYSIGQSMGRHLPDNTIIVDEGTTASVGPMRYAANAPAHDYLSLTGGSIGWGLNVSIGAAIACPDRKVVCLHGDGGAMYTPQALWTQARERLDIVTVIAANQSYRILNVELGRVGAAPAGAKALSMLSLADPQIQWTDLARSMGVEASRATTVEEFDAQFKAAMDSRGPRLIEAMI